MRLTNLYYALHGDRNRRLGLQITAASQITIDRGGVGRFALDVIKFYNRNDFTRVRNDIQPRSGFRCISTYSIVSRVAVKVMRKTDSMRKNRNSSRVIEHPPSLSTLYALAAWRLFYLCYDETKSVEPGLKVNFSPDLFSLLFDSCRFSLPLVFFFFFFLYSYFYFREASVVFLSGTLQLHATVAAFVLKRQHAFPRNVVLTFCFSSVWRWIRTREFWLNRPFERTSLFPLRRFSSFERRLRMFTFRT